MAIIISGSFTNPILLQRKNYIGREIYWVGDDVKPNIKYFNLLLMFIAVDPQDWHALSATPPPPQSVKTLHLYNNLQMFFDSFSIPFHCVILQKSATILNFVLQKWHVSVRGLLFLLIFKLTLEWEREVRKERRGEKELKHICQTIQVFSNCK